MKTLAWDVDDVLNSLMRVWFEDFLRKNIHRGIRTTYEQLSENPPHELLGMTLNQYHISLDEFRLSGRYERLEPNSEILNWFTTHGHCCRHLALTAVPLAAAPISSVWVLKHFGKWIRTFHFVPSKRAEETIPAYDRSKADFIGWHGKIDVLIDDNPEHIEQAAQIGLQGILITQPWNAGKMDLSETLASLTRAILN
jgi:hypothetical protein